MATLDISEYSHLCRDANGSSIQAGLEPRLAHQQITVGGASVASSAFQGNTTLVRVHTDVACRIAFGAAPVAAATTARMAANTTEFFGVKGGDKIAVITSA